jgi:hypothetical protein
VPDFLLLNFLLQALTVKIIIKIAADINIFFILFLFFINYLNSPLET